jgi:lipid A 3-O-deacylase
MQKGNVSLLRYILPCLWAIFFCNPFETKPAFSSKNSPPGQAETVTKGQWSLQLVTGSLFSTRFPVDHEHTMDYWQTNLRLGWILNDPSPKNSLFRGNFEAILEVTNSSIYKGPGNYLGGLTAIIRYNFVQAGLKLIPYVQCGAGIVYTDAYKDHSQDAIGESIEFTPQGSIGLRYLIRNNWSIDAECMFQHISNASLATRNDGINALGGFIGLTYFFYRHRK